MCISQIRRGQDTATALPLPSLYPSEAGKVFMHDLEARGATRAAVTLYDAIRIARAGGLQCKEHAKR
jgi:hypothetical protein